MESRTWPGGACCGFLLLLVLATVPAAARHPDSLTFPSNPFDYGLHHSGRRLQVGHI
jgi:hypothetical protein